MMDWLFIDDSREDRDSFAGALSADGIVTVTAISATEARTRLAESKLEAAGLLMDIDLSNESQSKESGLGLTADIRAAQHRETTPAFPIVRFSYRDKVAANIGSDSSSDDSFDLKIDKDRLSNEGVVASVQQKLLGVAEVYAGVGKSSTAEVFGLDEEHWAAWGSRTFSEELRLSDRTYVKARLVVLGLVTSGFLISEDVLAARLGVDRGSSKGWAELTKALSSIGYTGLSSKHFQRWWARGLEEWWAESTPDNPLAGTNIADRHAALSKRFEGLVPLKMREDSPGQRPWRGCELTYEETGEFLPLDPSRAVRFRARMTVPDWADPTYAALGPAIKHAEDPRLDAGDLKRLQSSLRKAQ
jgi:CheY-like chemotaxis protein